jgi:hypothetical protein
MEEQKAPPPPHNAHSPENPQKGLPFFRSRFLFRFQSEVEIPL